MTRRKQIAKATKRAEEKACQFKRNEEDIAQLKSDIIKNENLRKRISKATEYLQNIWEEKMNELEEEKRKRKCKFLKEIGAWKFNINPNESIKITMGEFRKTCNNFSKLNEHLTKEQSKLNEFTIRESEWTKYFVEKRRLDIAKEKIELMRNSQMKDSKKENKVEARNIIHENILQIQCSMAVLKKILEEKKCSEEKGIDVGSTFEDYIEKRLNELKCDIHKLNNYIKMLKKEQNDLITIVEDKSHEINNYKKQLKEIEARDVTKSQRYIDIVEKNEKLREELENYELLREQIAKETTLALNLLNENKSLIESHQSESDKLQQVVDELKTIYEEKHREKEECDKTCASIRNDITNTTELYYKMNEDVKIKKRKYDHIFEQHQQLMKRKHELQNHKNEMMAMFTQMSHDAQTKYA